MTETIDVRQEADWHKTIEYEKQIIGEMAAERELDFIAVNLFCMRDPRGIANWTKPNRVCLFGLLVGDSDEEVEAAKDAFAIEARVITLAGDAIAQVTVSEAWMVAHAEEDAGKLRVPPRDHPRRQEGIILIARHREFGLATWTSMIDRGEGGERILQPWTARPEFGPVEGRMAFQTVPHVVPEKETLHEMARVVLDAHAQSASPLVRLILEAQAWGESPASTTKS